MSVNARGTFLASKYAIPHLKKSKNPHILTISPPLEEITSQKTNWFAQQGTGYTLSKFGMTLVTHGLAGELKEDGIGCNTLWPRTAIATAAVKNLLGGDATVGKSRIPEIMGDAAYVIFTSCSKATTDNFYIDDEILASMNGPDMKKYRVDQKVQEIDMIPDFMV
ncbi:short-chain dehydrogenase [Stylonychia lemnae]|uniref:Short-chain dehydrogenase n=1 Tax=Stylonychia lemnae TaxID=5949 RepID=A0A078B8T5_STYLE|nr:short-chain dehydrogenase [Stylonychia lemnae]|eukprot:CDW89707.1 short-chain dehydrogenase [Stylonychia lemnae]